MPLELIAERRLSFELRPSAALVAYAQLLAVSSGEVERLIERELSENPALERAESAPQPRMPGWTAASAPREPADEPGVLAQLARDARASLPNADHPALDFLLGSIDDHGFLTVEPEDIARSVGTPLERVHAVHSLVRELGPVGFASRDIRDCLDAQLDQVADDRATRRARAADRGLLARRSGRRQVRGALPTPGRRPREGRRRARPHPRAPAAVSRPRRAAARWPGAAERARHHRRDRSRTTLPN